MASNKSAYLLVLFALTICLWGAVKSDGSPDNTELKSDAGSAQATKTKKLPDWRTPLAELEGEKALTFNEALAAIKKVIVGLAWEKKDIESRSGTFKHEFAQMLTTYQYYFDICKTQASSLDKAESIVQKLVWLKRLEGKRQTLIKYFQRCLDLQQGRLNNLKTIKSKPKSVQ